jgi:DNA-binding XRE family transcriptional regulator
MNTKSKEYENVAVVRKMLGMTAKELSQSIGVNERTIRSYESGEYGMSESTRAKLLDLICLFFSGGEPPVESSGWGVARQVCELVNAWSDCVKVFVPYVFDENVDNAVPAREYLMNHSDGVLWCDDFSSDEGEYFFLTSGAADRLRKYLDSVFLSE